MKYLYSASIIILLLTSTVFAECRNSESCQVVNCVRCTQPSNGKANGDTTIMSINSSPIKVYDNYNLTSCIPCSCGDGTTDEGEECDDGDTDNEDGCSKACYREYCGDGYKNLPSEECDDGNQSNADTCVGSCKNARCGDTYVSPAEECDKGDALNGKSGSFCSNICRTDKCLGTTESIDQLCGNNVVECKEGCDDGNREDGDGCSSKCKDENCVWIADSAYWSMERSGDNIWAKELASRDKVDHYEEVPSCFAQYWEKLCWFLWTDFYAMVEELFPDLKTEFETIKASSNPTTLINQKITPRLKEAAKTASGEELKTINKLVKMVHYLNVYYQYNNFKAVSDDLNEIGVTVLGACVEGGVIHSYNLGKFLGAPAGVNNYYMDKNCKYVSETNAASRNVCGFAGVAATPLSLILDESKYNEKSYKLVEFSLNLDQTQKYSVWKASEVAPLLVFDPEKTGKVESAAQLFGNWTFGGKDDGYFRKVSLRSSENKQPWSNGYEPLAVLDVDQDGKVSGAELNDLSLWFDENQNAAVDAGEMRTLADVGIKALYYKGAKQGKGRDLQLRLGYERELNGRIVSGRTVDWYGESFSNMKEAVDGLSAIFGNSKDIAQASTALNQSPGNFTPHKVDPDQYTKDLSGYWIWTLEGDRHAKRPGLLALEQHKDGTVTGYTVAEAKLADNELKLSSAVKILPLTGKVINSADGLSLEFEVRDPESGVVAKNKVNVHGGGMLLAGATSQLFAKQDPSDNESVKLTYRWVAGRS